MIYLLDANVFIEAKNRYYANDICPGFWKWMDGFVSGGNVRSIVNVRDELKKQNDWLADWVKSPNRAPWFMKVDDEATQKSFQKIVNHVEAADFKPHAKPKFLSGADPWLVAKARVLGATVVTQEVSRPGAKSRILLPDVCNKFGVPCKNTFDLLREHRASFTLKAA
ncbi:MAG: DUF4411 family protein [Alphaproteobacteria bacterium]